jgi:Rrf2 family protein
MIRRQEMRSLPSAERPMLSQTAEYALRAALYMAEHNDEPTRVGELAARLRVPQNYLSKTMHQLAKAGVLTSTRGKHGGFRLARPPEQIALYEIVAPFERPNERRQCLLGRVACSDAAPCAAHDRWSEVKARTNAFFLETSLKDLIHPNAASPAPRRRARARA